MSILASPMYFSEHDVSFTIWSLIAILTPVVNTVICIYFIIKDIDIEKLKAFGSFKQFLNDIKND